MEEDYSFTRFVVRTAPLSVESSVGYRTENHYRLSEYTGRLIIDYTIENYIHFTKNSNFHKTNLLHVHMAML